VWTSQVLSLGENLINRTIANTTEGATTSDGILFNYHLGDMKDQAGDVAFKRNNPYGFTAYDLFNNLEVGVKVGWQSDISPFGVCGRVTYGLDQYKLRFAGETGYGRHQLQSIRVGLNVSAFPWHYLLDESGWCPLLEVGAEYVKNIDYKGPDGNELSRVNDGLRTSYAIGIRLGEEGKTALMLYMDMAHYDLFNANFTPDGGVSHPYAGFSSKDMNFGVRTRIRIYED